jgi:isopentenyldiphosphate isomerase
MEILDIVNGEDRVIGKAPKDEIYKKLLTHRITHVLVFDDSGRMALQLRSKNVSFCPLHWCTSSGGHVLSGESYEQSASREMQEEIGIKAALSFMAKDLYTYRERNLSKFLVTFKSSHNGPFNPDPKEVDAVKFFSLGQIQEMIDNDEKFSPELLFLLEKHFNITV